jgi:HAMP domain-containing protein
MSGRLNSWMTKGTEFARLFKSRLSWRIVFWIFISLTIIEAILLIPSVERRKQEILNQVQEVSSGKIDWILMTYPKASGQELMGRVQQLYRDPMLRMILGGAMYRIDGTLVGTFGEPPEMPFNKVIQRDRLYLQRQGGDRYDAVWTALQPDGQYFIVIRHNAEGTQAALFAYALRIAGFVLIVSAFVTLVMMITLAPNVITPILTLRRDLAKAGEAVYHDHPTPKFDSTTIRRRDELGEVITAFQQMFQQIVQVMSERKQAEAELRETNEQMRRYIEQVDQVTAAAAAVENGTFRTDHLTNVATRDDELGQLARVFQTMVEQVREREAKLKQQVIDLQIEIDQVKLARQVEDITNSDYFQEICAEIQNLRGFKD